MSDEWAVVLTVETEPEGELVEGFLRSHEIPCEAESLLVNPYPTSLGALGVVKVRVPEDRAEEARRLLAERESMEFFDDSEPMSENEVVDSEVDTES